MFQVVILAGGLATRLRPITKEIPKALVEVNNRPFIDWQLRLLARKGVSRVLLCVSYKADLIENYVGDGSSFGLDVRYSIDGDKQLGTGGAIRKALPSLEDNFMVLYGDSYLDIDYGRVQNAFLQSGKSALMTVFRNNGEYDKSNIRFSNLGIEEYRKGSLNSEFEHIDYGLSIFKREIFESKALGEYFEMSELSENLSIEGKLAGYEVFNRFFEVGSFKGIKDLSNYLSKGQNDL
jgi:MurNAc alpha-1-phosphate uridylyltransferase